MAYLKFTNYKKPVQATAQKLDAHRVEVFGVKTNTSGFMAYLDAEMKHKLGDYSAFKTLYQTKAESFVLSDDGSVYPEVPEVDPEPTLSERMDNLEVRQAAAEDDISKINEAMGG